jgi:glycosyltransferase involved in cell wall biosynthesis
MPSSPGRSSVADAADLPPEEEVDELRAAVAGLQSQLDRVRRERDGLAREADEARRRLDAVYGSRTWRVGRALLYPPYRAKQLAQRNPRLRRVAKRLLGHSEAAPTPTQAATLPVSEDSGLRDAYAAALARQTFTPGEGRVVMCVSSVNLAEGRGDLYTAVGLGRQLERLGYEVVYRTPAGWYDLPEHTDLVIALIAERDHVFDPARLPRRVRTLAWIRNQTRRWAALPTLPLFDAVACSSTPTLRAIRRVHPGPHLLLPIAVDEALFRPGEEQRTDVVVTTTNAFNADRVLFRALAEGDLGAPLAMYGRTDRFPAALRPYAHGPVSFFALPSLYRAAALVLDDLQEVNRAHGNLNSRIYESLACGALPIANARAGLDEAGLADLPVAEDAAALREAVARFRREPAARDALVARLCDIVLARHTYTARAEALDAFLRTSVPLDAPRPPTVAFSPDYRVTNPYQDLLAAALPAAGVRTVPTDSPMALVRTGAVDPRQLVHHQHWTATILGPATSRREAERRCEDHLAELDELRRLGGRVLWTIHNALPHECSFPDVERRLQQGIADRADAIHVMCAETRDLVADVVRLPPDRTHVLPHGSYVDVYPNVVDPRQARLELGLEPDDVVLLSLGGIRPYRGIDVLLDAFAEAARDEPALRLVVAGRPGRHPSVPELQRRCEEHPRVLPYFEEVPDVDLQLFFNAADVAVFSHRAVLNSGGLLLAWSFGRPVIAPQTGCLTSQLADGGGIGYPPDRPGALADALRRAGTLATAAARGEAFSRAHEHTHLDMARGYAELIGTLLASARERP